MLARVSRPIVLAHVNDLLLAPGAQPGALAAKPSAPPSELPRSRRASRM